jgi:Domain of unknown function (DUF1905)/Bacteriocin-protection, YdeI or OmpD-Associated
MKRYKFKAKIEASDGGGAFVLFPYDTKTEFATKGKVSVKATVGGVPYTGSLMTCGGPHPMLAVVKTIREQIGKKPGDVIDVEVWRDDEARVVDVPPLFEKLLKKEGLLPVFNSLSFTHRKEHCRWIGEAKKEETRVKRFEKAIEMLRKGVSTPG